MKNVLSRFTQGVTQWRVASLAVVAFALSLGLSPAMVTAQLPDQTPPDLPPSVQDLALGDHGDLSPETEIPTALVAYGVGCVAPNLIAIVTAEGSYYAWTVAIEGFGCEEIRRDILLAAIAEEELTNVAAVFGREVALRYSELAEPTPAGGFLLSVDWQGGGSAAVVVYRAWVAPAT